MTAIAPQKGQKVRDPVSSTAAATIDATQATKIIG